MRTADRVTLSCWPLIALALIACSSPLLLPPRESTTLQMQLPLSFTPTYLIALWSEEGILLYLEDGVGEQRTGHGMLIDPSTLSAELHPSLAVPHFNQPFGEVVVYDGGLLIPVVQLETRIEMVWELWRWTLEAEPTRLLRCVLPRAVHGQLLQDREQFYVLFEDPTGTLVGFLSPLDEPACPKASDLVTLASPPLPSSYHIDWLGERIMLAGQGGESYTLHAFNRELQLVRRHRLAPLLAIETADLSTHLHPVLGPLVVFSASRDGSRDLYLANLASLTAGPLLAERVIATAEAERSPALFSRGDRTVITWQAVESSGNLLELGLAVPLDGTLHRGGEVLWRHDGARRPVYTSTWSDEGFVSIWVELIESKSVLVIRRHRPSFW